MGPREPETQKKSPKHPQPMPMRKRTIAISSNARTAAIVASIFHDSQSSTRICRTITFSRGVVSSEFHSMNSRIHCLARMLNSAAARLRTRLVNRSALIQCAEADGENGWESRTEVMVMVRVGGM